MYIFLLTTCFVGILLPSFLSLLELVNNGIPLWFRCFKGNNDPNAFSLSLINQGISFVHDLFKDKNCKLIFLADRWFNFREIMQHIESLSCTYCIRTKTNVAIEIDNYEYSDMNAYISDIEPFYASPIYFDSVKITSFKFQTKLVVSKTAGHLDML